MTAIVFGSLPFPGQSGDQLVSKAVTGAIASLFKRTEKLEANVKAEPLAKLLQGSVDGFDFVGNGLVMYNGLRLEGMELYLQAVSIDFSAVFSGKISLRQPTQATMRIVLTQQDLTTSFNTPFIVDKLQKVQYEGNSLHFQNTEFNINSDKSIDLCSEVGLGSDGDIIPISIKANMELEGRTKIKFTNPIFQGDEKAQSLSEVLINHVNNLLDLDKFALDGSRLKVDRLRIKDQEVVFYGTLEMNHFPNRK